MRDNKLSDLSMELAVSIVNTCKAIRATQKETVLTNQLLRSGTSVGANIREANYASSKQDFIAKLHISLKECYESEYWIELLQKTNYLQVPTAKSLLAQLGSIRRMLVASINTAKNHQTK